MLLNVGVLRIFKKSYIISVMTNSYDSSLKLVLIIVQKSRVGSVLIHGSHTLK